MKILAIVVTYNGLKWYDRCFTSLKSSTIPVDIFVADNASSDGTVDYIRTNYSDIILYESAINIGFGQANNKGLRYALDNNYDFVFLLNQDAWLAQDDAIEQLITAYKNSYHVGILSPVHLYGSGIKIVNSMRKNLVNHNKPDSDLLSDLFFNRALKNFYYVDYACAAAWFMPVKIIREIGGFDPLFFHYGEDDNYIQRITYHGHKIGICPYASICHDIEFRAYDYGRINNNWQKNFLVEISNVNGNLCLFKRTLQYFYFSLVKLLFFKYKAFKSNIQIALFIVRKSKNIRRSYFNNKVKKPNWL